MGSMLAAVNILWLLLLLFSSSANANRISESIYQDLDATYSCFKIMNGTHEFGCTADFSGNVGLLRLVNSTDDVTALTSSGEQQPVVALMPRQQFTVDVLQRLEAMTADPDQGEVKGVILLLPDEAWGPDEPFQFSEDDTCPNRWSSFYRSEPESAEFQYCLNTPWNPAGTGMFKRSWSFPIILLKNRTQIDDLLQCHNQYNSAGPSGPWPRCAAELKALMNAAGNTEICTRRTNNQYINTKSNVFCQPMGSVNLFSTWAPRGGDSPPSLGGETVLLAARTDGATMFDSLAPAADSAVAGMVALIAVARAMAEMEVPEKAERNVMFMLFSGESFDYIGSDRMVYDMSQNKFPPASVPKEDESAGSVRRPPPLHLSDVSHYLELNQLARGETLYLHSDPVSRGINREVERKVREVIDSLLTASRQFNLSVSETGTPLPPSSLHALLRGNDTVPGLVLTDHNSSYSNSFFHSVYDISSTITGGSDDFTELVERIGRIQQTVAGAVYKLATGQEAPGVTVHSDWIKSLLECYLVRANCSLFRDVMDEQTSEKNALKFWQKDVPLPTYVSVPTSSTRHAYLMRLTGNLLSRWTGVTMADVTQEDRCRNASDAVFERRWLVRQFENGTLSGYCVRSLVAVSAAVSPAFEIEDYDWSSGAHPSWSESQWTSFKLRMFLQPSLGHQLAHLLLGIAVTVAAVGIVLLMERRSHLLFETPRYRLQS